MMHASALVSFAGSNLTNPGELGLAVSDTTLRMGTQCHDLYLELAR